MFLLKMSHLQTLSLFIVIIITHIYLFTLGSFKSCKDVFFFFFFKVAKSVLLLFLTLLCGSVTASAVIQPEFLGAISVQFHLHQAV